MQKEKYSLKEIKNFVKPINVYKEAEKYLLNTKIKNLGPNNALSIVYNTNKGNYLLSGGTIWLMDEFMKYLIDIGEIKTYKAVCNLSVVYMDIPKPLKNYSPDKKYFVYLIDLENSEINYETISAENIKEARNKAKLILKEELKDSNLLEYITVYNLKKEKYTFGIMKDLNENFTNYKYVMGCKKI